MEDAEIVGLFLDRDELALTEFDKKYKRVCLSVSREITSSLSDAEECYNDTCLALWSSIPPQKPGSLKAYALRITRNLSLNRVKRNNTQKRCAILVELDECISESVQDSLDEADSREIGRAIDEFLEKLPRTEAVIFVQRYLCSRPVKEIALSLGKTENQVSKILAKARKRLKKHLEERGISV